LLDIESILYELNIHVLRETGDELLAKCPMHLARTGKEDGHPSWSINAKTYVHHCFSCGYAGSLSTLYRDIVGEVPDDLEWELSKQSVLSSFNRDKPVEKEIGPNVDEWSLQNYTDLPDRLLERRHLSREAADHFEIRWDSKNKTWVIPVRTPSGKLMGYQFRQKGIVLNHPTGMEKSTTLFGFHLFKNESKITIVESPLDAVRLYVVGIPAVSSFGAAISSEQMNLLSRTFRYVISAMDNDSVGKRATDLLHKRLTKKGCVVFDFDYNGLDVKDPGDVVSDEDLLTAWQRSISLNLTNH
jgi:DNA primase